MLPDVRLETARLILRTPRLEDFDAWAAATADPRVVRRFWYTEYQ